MKHLRKRALSLLLAAVMTASLLPTTAWAATEPARSEWVQGILDELNAPYTDPSDVKYQLLGPAPLEGSELYTWTVQRSEYNSSTGKFDTDTRYIIVPGVGATDYKMPDYGSADDGQPWISAGISTVYIAEEITSIGDNAFNGLTTLNNVVFQDASSITSIGSHAFSGDNKAVFTDESGEGESLDLSSVTSMGEYAFSGCAKLTSVTLGGSITAHETDEEGQKVTTPNKIPSHAFSGTGLTGIEIPAGTAHIGDSAFENCPLTMTELTLPDGLKTIGESAFARGTDSPNRSLEELTIPASVESIGAEAFINYHELQTVKVLGLNNGGSGLSQLKEVGLAAFGNAAHNSHTEQGTITHPEHPELTYSGQVGTEFYLPQEVDPDLFTSGETCYTGDIPPLTYDSTKEPTCTEAGYYRYVQYIPGWEVEGNPVPLYIDVTIPALGHDWELSKSFPASCESAAYELWVCANDNTHTQNRVPETPSLATDHNYTLTEGAGAALGSGAVTFTWECQQLGHDKDRDGGKPKVVSITVNPAALTADTGMTYGDLTLPKVTGGTLSLAESVDRDDLLTTNVTTVPVVFTPNSVTYAGYTGMGPVENLTLAIQVEKAVLDFSGVRFSDCIADINPEADSGTTAPGITVVPTGLPSDVTEGQHIYQSGDGEPSETPPLINATWDGTVSVTFTYDTDKYQVDESKFPPESEYTTSFGKGTVTITHSYRIMKMSMSDLKGEAIENLTYTGQALNTVHLSGVPNNSTITWEWVNTEDGADTGRDSTTNTATGVNVAPIKDAGTYQVTVHVSKAGYDTPEPIVVTVTIAKAPVAVPQPLSTLEAYTGAQQQGLAEPGENDLYIYTEGSVLAETAAGTYKAQAELTDKENYRWASDDGDGDGIVDIQWGIERRPVVETAINALYSSPVPYDGKLKTAVGEPALATGFFTFTYEEGTLVGRTKETKVLAFTITNAQQTDAGTYPVKATIKDPANFYWQEHPNKSELDLGTWVISQLQIVRPTVRAGTVTYDGAEYEAGNITLTDSEGTESILGSKGLVTLGTDHTYYASGTAETPMDSAPIDAGRYYVEPDLVYDSTNYDLVGGEQRVSLIINKAQLTLTAPTEESELKVSYDGQPHTVPAPEVEGWKESDSAESVKDFALSYSYIFTPEGGQAGEPQTATGKLTVSEAGSYAVTVTVDDGCQNYTEAAAVEYIFNIGAAGQEVVLTSDDDDWTGTSITKTLGEAGFTVTGTGSLDESSKMKYTYESETDGMLTVDETTGEVTMHKAGTATVTVSTEGTANAGKASASYTVTVEQATPTVTVKLPEGGQDGVYGFTGTALDFTATVTGAGNGAVDPTGTENITYTFYASDEEGKQGQSLGEDQPTAVGTYWVTAAYGGDDNYTERTSAAQSFTISPAQLSVQVIKPYDGKTYDGSAHDAAEGFTVTGNGQTLTEGVIITYAESAAGEYTGKTMPQVTNAGEYTVYYKVSVPNYGVYTGDFTVTVKPFEVSLDGEVAKTKPYDGKQDAQVKTVNGASYSDGGVTIAGAGTEEFTVQADALYNDADAGKGTVITITYTLSGADLSNYTYNGEPITGSTVTQEVTGASITPREITVVGVDAVDRKYDGTEDVTLTTKTDSFGFAAGAIVPEDEGKVTLTFVGGTGTVKNADASDAPKTVTVTPGSVVALSGDDAKNYIVTKVVTDTNSDEIDVVISQRKVTLSVKDVDSENKIEKGYTGSAITLTAEIKDGVFVNYVTAGLSQEDVDFAYMQGGAAAEPITQGIYDVTVSLKDDAADRYPNFNIQRGGCTLEITNATLEVTSATYTGTYTGLSHDVLKGWSFTSTTEKPVDASAVTVTFQKVGADNADEPNTDGVWIASDSFVNASQSGSYWYKAEYESHNTVYGANPVSIKINPAPLTLNSSLSKTEKTYDGTTDIHKDNGTLTSKVTGIVEKDKAGVSITVAAAYVSPDAGTPNIEVKYTFAFTGGVLPGNYQYDDTPLTGDDVLIQTVSGTIDKAPLTIELEPQSSVYDGDVPLASSDEGTWKVTSGEIYSQNDEEDDLGITLKITGAKADADTYPLTATATGTDSGNYEIRVTDSTYIVDKRPVTIQIGGASGVYGDDPNLSGVTLTDVTPEEKKDAGLVDDMSDVVTVSNLSTTVMASSAAGTTGDITAIPTGSKADNYDITWKSGTYTQNKRPMTVTLTNQEGIYGQEHTAAQDKFTLEEADRSNTVVQGDRTGEDLTFTLTVDADSDSPVGAYDISGAVDGNKAGNYLITWTGEGNEIPGSDDQKYGKYTVEQAGLEIRFTYGNQVTNGVSINITDTYDSNALELENETTGAAVSGDDKGTLNIAYTIGPAGGGNGDVSSIAEINSATGAVTIRSTGTVRITATVTPQDDSNYTGTESTWYELNIIGGGSMSMWVTPAQGLTYNGGPQNLLTAAGCTLEGAELSYRLEGENDWSATIPQAEDAGSYTVHYKAEDPSGQYADYENHVTVEIAKADLEGSFQHGNSFTFPLTQGSSYDSATENPLTISEAENPNYTANPGTYTYQSSDSAVASADNAGSTILVRGQAGESAVITVTVPGDGNYNSGVFQYTLHISDDMEEIVYTVSGEEDPIYNGQAHTRTVEVTVPASGAQVLYANETGAYTLTAPPAYTDVKRNADTGAVESYEIKFRITAPGYTPAEGSATLTIQPKPITKGMFEDSIGSYTYTGKQIVPEPVVTDGTLLLVKGKDYTVIWGEPNQYVGVYDETAQTGGTVTVTGMGNYGGADTDTFEITAVGQNSLTAAMTRSWGVYGDSATNSTDITVSHGDMAAGGHPVDGGEITIAVTDSDGNPAGEKAEVNGQTVTFREVGQYTLTVTVSGNHSGSFTLHYTLLPAGGDEGLTLTVDGEPTPAVYTYGDKVNGDITVEANDKALTEGQDYTLTYSYQPFVTGANTQPVEAGTAYDPAQVFGDKIPAAGLYVVTAKAVPDGSYTGSGTFVFLVQQKNLEDEMLEAIGGETYTGEKIEPGMTVTFTGITPDDYEVSYQDNINVGTARATVTAKAESNNFTGAASASFTIAPKDLSQFTVAPVGEQRHTGAAITPALTVTDPDRAAALIQGLDFTADYENNINVGEAQVTITGTGNYTGTITGTTFRIVATVSSFDLALDKTAWTWGESGPADAKVSYTSGGAETPLAIGTDYVLTVDGTEYTDMDAALEALGTLEPGTHTVTARGKTGTGYAGLSDTVTVTISKIQPVLSVAASPHTLSDAGTVTLTLRGENLPADVDNLPELLTVAATGGTAPDLEKLTWTEEPAGTWTAEVSLPNASSTYTFTLAFTPDGEDVKYYESVQAADTVVTAQHTSSGGGGGGGGQPTAFTITASGGAGGAISPAGTVAVTRGASQSFAVTPAEGYEIADVLVDGDSVGAVSSYTFSNVVKDHTITAEFARTQEVSDPDETGVSGWLNTADHMAYMQGYPGSLFGPDDNMTRAEAAQMFYNLLLDKNVTVTVSFTDVEEGAWYSRAVNVLATLGMINGVGGEQFAPERSITRAEFTAMAMRFARLETGGENPFSDVYEHEWFYDVVVGSVRYGWINGYPDGTFRPYDTISRAEAAAATNRMLGRAADRDYVDAHRETLTRFADLSTGYWAYYEIMEAANGHDYRRTDGFEHWTGLT